MKRRAVNVTVREDILDEAKSLNLNTSRAAEAGISTAVRKAREKEWLASNQSALQAHNDRVAGNGPALKPRWAAE